MSSVSNILRMFRGAPSATGDFPAVPAASQERIARRSSGLTEFTRSIAGQEHLCVLDLGPTSASNITHFTNLAYKSYNEDVLLASMDSTLDAVTDEGAPTINVKRFLQDNLNYE